MDKFEIRLRRRNVPESELLEDLRRVADAQGTAIVTRLQYDKHGSFGATTIVRKFKGWNNAIKLAGLQVACRQDITIEELFKNLAEVWGHLGYQPFGRHMDDRAASSQFSLGTYEKRFGSWNKALIAFSDYLAGTGELPEGNNPVQPRGVAGNRSTDRKINWRLRARILIRDSCICQMCGTSPAKNTDCVLHVDHVLPWSKGGETVEENLQTLCDVCNIGKGDLIVEPSIVV
jgi:Homing endonuclease associated repeat/HNH endonuclease